MSTDPAREARLAEYGALRAEILLLIQSRNQFWLFDLTAFGALFVVGIQFEKPVSFLVAPLIHYPLMLYWSYADRHIQRIGVYTKDYIEPNVFGLNWEGYVYGRRLNSLKSGIFRSRFRLRSRFYETQFSAFATFAGTTAVALLIWTTEMLPEPGRLIDTFSSDAFFIFLAKIDLTKRVLLVMDLLVFPCAYVLIRRTSADLVSYVRNHSSST